MAESCIIGRGIQIKGNLTGNEDLVVEGQIEGHITLKNHLTIMESGEVTADMSVESLEVNGKVSGNIEADIETETVEISGNVTGNIEADDLVSLSSSSYVVADIRAPRVVIEDGARFKGRVEMDVELPPDLL